MSGRLGIVAALAALALVGSVTNLLSNEYSYARVLEQMQENIEKQIELNFVGAEKIRELKPALTNFVDAMRNGAEDLSTHYDRTYLGQGEGFSTNDFHKMESRYSIFLEQSLQKLLTIRRLLKQSKSPLSEIQSLTLLLDDFKEGRPTQISMGEHLQTVAPFKSKRAQMIFRLLASSRFAFSKPEVFEWLSGVIKPEDYALSLPQIQVSNEDIENLEFQKEPSVHIFLVNHEAGLLEVLLGANVLDKLQVDQNFLLTFRRVFGLFSGRLYDEKSTVFVEDGKSLKELESRILESFENNPEKSIGLVMAPEGMLPSIAAFNPISVKPGGLILARRLAAQGVPVKIWVGHFNGYSYLSSEQGSTPFQFQVTGPINVPTDELKKPDPWVDDMRLLVEKILNQSRATRVVDLSTARHRDNTSIPLSCAISLLAVEDEA